MTSLRGEGQYVVVVLNADGTVVAVLGPREERLEAEALRDVLRRDQGEPRPVIARVREANVRDVHGSGFDA